MLMGLSGTIWLLLVLQLLPMRLEQLLRPALWPKPLCGCWQAGLLVAHMWSKLSDMYCIRSNDMSTMDSCEAEQDTWQQQHNMCQFITW